MTQPTIFDHIDILRQTLLSDVLPDIVQQWGEYRDWNTTKLTVTISDGGKERIETYFVLTKDDFNLYIPGLLFDSLCDEENVDDDDIDEFREDCTYEGLKISSNFGVSVEVETFEQSTLEEFALAALGGANVLVRKE